MLDAEDRPMLAVTLAMVAVIPAGLSEGRVRYEGDLDASLFFLALVWVCGHAAQVFGLKVVDSSLKSVAVLAFVAIITAVAGAVLATFRLPWADPMLLKIDQRLLGQDLWPKIVNVFSYYRSCMLVLSLAYVSLFYQPFLLVILLSVSGRADQIVKFITAWVLSLATCLAVFPLAPARGAYVYFGIPPEAVPGVRVMSAWHAFSSLEALRNRTVDVLGSATLEGLITMPSFHACAAVLLAWAFAGIRWARWPFAVLNLLMWVSAVPIGGHYIVDVLAGSLVAIAAIVASEWLSDRARARRSPVGLEESRLRPAPLGSDALLPSTP